MDWAGEKPARMSATKLIRSSGMLQFQKADLHAPLTKAAAGGAKPGVIASVHAKMFAKKYDDFDIISPSLSFCSITCRSLSPMLSLSGPAVCSILSRSIAK